MYKLMLWQLIIFWLNFGSQELAADTETSDYYVDECKPLGININFTTNIFESRNNIGKKASELQVVFVESFKIP